MMTGHSDLSPKYVKQKTKAPKMVPSKITILCFFILPTKSKLVIWLGGLGFESGYSMVSLKIPIPGIDSFPTEKRVFPPDGAALRKGMKPAECPLRTGTRKKHFPSINFQGIWWVFMGVSHEENQMASLFCFIKDVNFTEQNLNIWGKRASQIALHLSNLGVVKKHVEKVFFENEASFRNKNWKGKVSSPDLERSCNDFLGVAQTILFGNDNPKTHNTWVANATFAGHPFRIFLVDPHEIVCH